MTSLYAQNLNKDLGDNFKKCLEFRDVREELFKDYNDNFDFIELGKLAIDYSDGIIQADQVVNEDLLNYAKGKNIPVLGYHKEFADEYEAFYDQIYPDEPEVEEE